jgi:hypothetical protein
MASLLLDGMAIAEMRRRIAAVDARLSPGEDFVFSPDDDRCVIDLARWVKLMDLELACEPDVSSFEAAVEVVLEGRAKVEEADAALASAPYAMLGFEAAVVELIDVIVDRETRIASQTAADCGSCENCETCRDRVELAQLVTRYDAGVDTDPEHGRAVLDRRRRDADRVSRRNGDSCRVHGS